MKFKEFLFEYIAKPDEIKDELEKIGKGLMKYFQDNFGDDFKPIGPGFDVRKFRSEPVVKFELEASIINQGYKKAVLVNHKGKPGQYSTGRNTVHNTADIDEINKVLKKAMEDAKKVLKKYGVKQNKEIMSPGASAKAKARGTDVILNFWICYDKGE